MRFRRLCSGTEYCIYILVSTKADVEYRVLPFIPARANRKKHGVSFEVASLVFDDPLHISLQDREVDGEERWQTIGMIANLHVLVVAHTVHAHTVHAHTVDEDAELIRILSPRKATPRERSIYAQGS